MIGGPFRHFKALFKPDSDDPLDVTLIGSRRILTVSMLALGVFFIWANIATLEEITRAPAIVIASSRTQLIQSQDGGVLEQLLVKEGDRVVAGQVLALIDETRARAAFLEARSKVAALSAQQSRLMAELFDTQPQYERVLDDYPDFIQRQNSLLVVRLEAHLDELSAMDIMKVIVQEQLAINLPLYRAGDVSQSDILTLERQVAELSARISKVSNDYLQDVESQLTRVNGEVDASRQLLKQRKSLLDQTKLISSMDGIVKSVAITTVGGVVRPGEDVMQIVPTEDQLLFEAKVSPKDIAFVNEGMAAFIKVDAWDYTIFGDLHAEVIFVSADTVEREMKAGELPSYTVRLRSQGARFDNKRAQNIKIQPGMTATAEILTGERTVFQYLAKPIIKTLDESFSER
ncbi:HlyD family efflux transporter periplasmic adaptor subunit [Porticoccaceae bacterium]|nr:HlyD family efflux transporter periplasmic adaptor subunit [Porticoccaceae bacterium]MDB9949599.1 HlyD family efflux transporter periplasmic adaptor subunit [Porticoccaceae bacterium]